MDTASSKRTNHQAPQTLQRSKPAPAFTTSDQKASLVVVQIGGSGSDLPQPAEKLCRSCPFRSIVEPTSTFTSSTQSQPGGLQPRYRCSPLLSNYLKICGHWARFRFRVINPCNCSRPFCSRCAPVQTPPRVQANVARHCSVGPLHPRQAPCAASTHDGRQGQ